MVIHLIKNNRGANEIKSTLLQSVDVENALIQARSFAMQELNNLPQGAKLVPTEFGYEIVMGENTVSWYWVHPHTQTGVKLILQENVS